MLWDVLLTFTLAAVVFVQHMTIKSHKRSIFILAEQIKKNSSTKSPDYKNWQPKIIQGELDMIHQGKKATVKAIFYPKKVV